MSRLFSNFGLGNLELKNRIVMAPMTRSRAVDGNVPSPLAVQYYEQRASAGLIISEGSQVSSQGVGYIRTPGIYSAKQVEGWKKVTSAVHKKGGKIFLQLWHVGRVSHPDFHGGELPVAPSAIGFDGESYTPQGRKKTVVPRALELSEIPGIVEQFRTAAQNAKDAGFDGVEIHGANGYLLDQFTRDCSNKRTDAYGGSVQNRIRLPLEVTKAVISVFGADRVGYRVSPYNPFNGMSDSNPIETFTALAEGLDRLGIGYLHILEAVAGQMHVPNVPPLTPILRKSFKGAYIVNGGYDVAAASAVLERDEADLVAFGVPFISNPDLVERFKRSAPLNAPDFATFYMGEEKGYVDYPALA
jgi:N-ethylmaleimide reductase